MGVETVSGVGGAEGVWAGMPVAIGVGVDTWMEVGIEVGAIVGVAPMATVGRGSGIVSSLHANNIAEAISHTMPTYLSLSANLRKLSGVLPIGTPSLTILIVSNLAEGHHEKAYQTPYYSYAKYRSTPPHWTKSRTFTLRFVLDP